MTFILFWLIGLLPVLVISTVLGIGTANADNFLKCLFIGSAFAAFPAYSVYKAEKTFRNM